MLLNLRHIDQYFCSFFDNTNTDGAITKVMLWKDLFSFFFSFVHADVNICMNYTHTYVPYLKYSPMFF